MADAAELFFVTADFGGEGFDAGAELVYLDGEAGEGERVAVALAVFFDEGAQLGVAVESGPADAGAAAAPVMVTGFPAARSSWQACSRRAAGSLVTVPASVT